MASLECPHLGFHFKKDEYALILLGNESFSEHVILIHEISYCGNEYETGTANLLVSKYSRFASIYPLSRQLATGNEDILTDSRELLLHFENFEKMGSRDDAEVIQLDDIVHAAELAPGSHDSPGEVDHVLQPPGRQRSQNMTPTLRG